MDYLAATAGWEIVTAVATCVAAVASIFAATGVLFAFLSVRTGVGQLEEVRTDRHIQILGELGLRWADESLEQSRALMVKHRAKGLRRKVETSYRYHARAAQPGIRGQFWSYPAGRCFLEIEVLLRVPNFFEDVALLVETGGLDFDLVWRAFAGPARGCWDYWSPAIKYMQEGDPGSYVEFETLVRKLRERPDPSALTSAAAEAGSRVEAKGMPSRVPV